MKTILRKFSSHITSLKDNYDQMVKCHLQTVLRERGGEGFLLLKWK